MSVPVYQRNPQKFEILTIAINLASHICKIAGNEQNFPKKYRWMLTQPIVQQALNIVTYIRMANAIKVENSLDYDQRKSLQDLAYGSCEALYTLLQVSLESMPISIEKVEYISEMLFDLEEKLISWQKSDYRRFGNISQSNVE